MRNYNEITQDAMRELIHTSCEVSPNSTTELNGFQKSLLKFYFNVADVTIDYDKKNILLWNSHSHGEETPLYFLSDARVVKVSYTNLEETLKGCLESGEQQVRFYRNLLFYYNILNSDDTELWSA